MEDFFENEGFYVLDCINIYEAIENWVKHNVDIDIIVTDLNMNSNGLTADEAALTEDGQYSGWLWLLNYVLNDYDRNTILNKIFILSEYNKNLKEKVDKQPDFGKDAYEKIDKHGGFIDKGDYRGALDLCLKAIRKNIR